jgi:hypothetical protein
VIGTSGHRESIPNEGHKVPPAYSRAGDYARSLYVRRDDVRIHKTKGFEWDRGPSLRFGIEI